MTCPDPAVFDQAGLLRRLMGNKPLAEKVVNAFLQTAPSQLSNLRRHLAAQDAPAACREAHTLKGAAATVSALALRSVALRAEQAAAAGKWARSEQLMADMEEELERLRGALANKDTQ
jgi:two-component system sensor histidine kinase/response regulator